MDYLPSFPTKARSVIGLIPGQKIHQVVANLRMIRKAGLRRTNTEATVHLHRVTVHDLTVVIASQRHG
jgi:hypothetical protein